MATCEVREIALPKPPVEYVLTLTEKEAFVLRGLYYRIGGSLGGPRGCLFGIDRALSDAGVQVGNMRSYSSARKEGNGESSLYVEAA